MKKTTRSHDLDLLDDSRLRVTSEEGFLHRNAILDAVFVQSQDEELERMRNELAHWINYGLAYAPDDLETQPNLHQMAKMAEAEKNIQRLEKSIKKYAQSDDFRSRILKAIAKHNPVEAVVKANKEL